MVNSKPPAITLEEIERLKSQINPLTGKYYTQNEIAALHGISRSQVSKIKRQTGRFSKTAREAAMEHFPWDVKESDHWVSLHKLVRDHMTYMATDGEGMSPQRLYKLRMFYEKILPEDLVVEFDPTTENRLYRFRYRPREERDEDLIVGVNEYTRISEEGRRLLRPPDEIPDVSRSEF